MNTTTFEIAAPGYGAKQVAEETREFWASWIAEHEKGEVPATPEPDQLAIEKVRAAVSTQWLRNIMQSSELHQVHQEISASDTRYYFCLNYPYGARANSDETGILFHEAMKKYSSEVSRLLHEHKQTAHPNPYLTSMDWTVGTVDLPLYVGCTDEHRITIEGQCLFRYVQGGETFVGGFFTEQDKRRFRYTSKRLGSYLASLGWDDLSVREFVEHDRVSRAAAKFTIYPNDITWGDLYVGGVDSCMSRQACSYDSSKFDVHPVDVYASSYFGSGDNKLALFTTQDADGKLIGRGIVSCATQQCVRWYGDYNGERALKNAGIRINEDALADSWLALIGDNESFVHPYVDGCFYYGQINKNSGRIYLDDSDGHDLEDTSGLQYNCETVYCAVTDRSVPMHQATYFEWQDIWVHDDVVDGYDRCHVTDEPLCCEYQCVQTEYGDDVWISFSAYHCMFNRDMECAGWRVERNKYGERYITRC